MWRRPCNTERLASAQEVYNYQSGAVMVWCGISIGARNDPVLLEDFLNAVSYQGTILHIFVFSYAALGPNFSITK